MTSRAFLALVAILGLGGCLTEDVWEEHTPLPGRECVETGVRACSGSFVVRCSVGTWILDTTCGAGETCVDGACRCPGGDCCGNGKCEKSRGEDCKTCAADCGSCCTPGTVKCEGTTLKTCSSSQTWTSESCSGLCKAAGYPKVTGCSYASDLKKDVCWCGHDGKIGDPCTSSSDCALGNGSWCQKSCQSFEDCGINSLGYTNWCLSTKAGNRCFPSCLGAKCEARFPGATCQPVPNSSLEVCSE